MIHLVDFLPFLTREKNFCNFMFVFLQTKSKWSEFFSFRVGRQNILDCCLPLKVFQFSLQTGVHYKKRIKFHSVIWCCLYVALLPGSIKSLTDDDSVILSLDLKEVTSPVNQQNYNVCIHAIPHTVRQNLTEFWPFWPCFS